MWKFFEDLRALARAFSSSPRSSEEDHSAPVRIERQTVVCENRADRRTRYIRTQAYKLAERFSKDGGQGIQLDEQEYNWLIIPKYPMPARWKQRWTRLMILFPAGYPDVPPTGFYLTIRAGLKGGGQDRHLFKGGGFYENAPDLSKNGWFWYCVHAQVQAAGRWEPSADPDSSDNLFTFLNMVREALTQ